MKIILRSFWRKDDNLEKKILTDSELSKYIPPNSTSHEFDADNPLFERFLEVIRDTPNGCSFQSVMEYSKSEVEKVSLFQLDLRGKILKESKLDEQLNIDNLTQTRPINTYDSIEIKIIQNIYLSKITLSPDTIGGTQLLEEFIISEAIAKVFTEAGLIGFKAMPINNSKTGELYNDYFQLFTDCIMPLAELDNTTLVTKDCDGENYFRELGCLTYCPEDLGEIGDFNRTAENWASNNMPLWIVTSRTKKCYDQNKLKGLHFRPVLQKGTALHHEYIRKWENLFMKINTNPKNRIC